MTQKQPGTYLSYTETGSGYPGTFTFYTTDPLQAFDKVKVMSAILGQEIKLEYNAPQNISLTVNQQSTKKAFAAAMSKEFKAKAEANGIGQDALFYEPHYHAYSLDLAGENLLSKHVQEIANKTGATVDYLDQFDGVTIGITPEKKKPSSSKLQQRQP